MHTVDPVLSEITRALDVCMLRQSAYAANIANANVADYRRVDVIFENELERATAALSQTGAPSTFGSAFGSAGQATAQSIQTVGGEVRLDREMALMAENAVRYQALMSTYEKMTGLLRLAVREGREG